MSLSVGKYLFVELSNISKITNSKICPEQILNKVAKHNINAFLSLSIWEWLKFMYEYCQRVKNTILKVKLML